MFRKVWSSAVLALVLTIRVSGQAWAADETVEDLISKGVELRRQGQHERALELFRRAHAEEPSPRTLAQIGLAEQSLKRWIESEGHLTSALESGSHPWIRKNRAHLQNALEAVRSHIGHLMVEGTPGATVYVQGEPRGTLPLSGPIRQGEGEVKIQVAAPGRQGISRAVTVRPGDVTTVTAQLDRLPTGSGNPIRSGPAVPASNPQPNARPEPTEPGRARGVLPWAFLGVAGAAAALAVWQHIAWQNDVAAFDGVGQCGTGDQMRGANSRCQDLYDRYTGERTRALVAYGFAGAFGAAAAVFFVVNGHGSQEPPPSTGLRPGPGTIGLAWSGSF